MTPAAAGALAMIGACMIWGLSPLYYALLAHLSPLDVLAHRTIWSLGFFGLTLALLGRGREVAAALGSPGRALRTALAALAISANWGLFIYAVSVGRVTEASLGYYIFPLASALVGLVVFRERPGRAAWAAIALATVAVGILTRDAGALPAISLGLAATFAGYAAIKRGTLAAPLVSVTAEVALLTPLAVLWLLLATHWPGWRDMALLLVSGPLTALPLMLFSFAARRVGMVTLGLIQYLNPTLQACTAVVMGEVLGPAHAVAFALIWTALAIYSAGSARRVSQARTPLPRGL